MREYLTEAVVLGREISGETSARISLYTKELGRVTARAQGASLMTSRLSAYLQPLRHIQVRLVEKNGIQIVDALPKGNKGKFTSEKIGLSHIVQALTSEYHPDERLWDALAAPSASASKILIALGFDPRHATCHMCESHKSEYFSIRDAHYYCAKCVKTFSSIDGLYRLGRVTV